MGVPWGETTRAADPRIYDVPSPPPVPAQLDPPGWQWESAGTSGTERKHPPYTIVETYDMKNYFDHQRFPPSSEQYRGQPGKP